MSEPTIDRFLRDHVWIIDGGWQEIAKFVPFEDRVAGEIRKQAQINQYLRAAMGNPELWANEDPKA